MFVVEDDQKRGLERELMELRAQMSRSAGATSEAEDVRRAFEKSERQRVQLSDHIDVRKNNNTVKLVLSGHTKRRPKLVFKTDYHLMQVKSIAECPQESILVLWLSSQTR